MKFGERKDVSLSLQRFAGNAGAILTEIPNLSAEDYGRFIRNVATYMAEAADSLSKIGRRDWQVDASACNHFAVRSADAAEFRRERI